MPYPAMRGMTRYTAVVFIAFKPYQIESLSFQAYFLPPWLCHASMLDQFSSRSLPGIHRATAYGHTPRSGVSPYPAMRAFNLKSFCFDSD